MSDASISECEATKVLSKAQKSYRDWVRAFIKVQEMLAFCWKLDCVRFVGIGEMGFKAFFAGILHSIRGLC
ncbi:MAG TPA: hypothetical protein DCE56_22095 [Cyanobacteria bacterium UBA8553]|nr:hypothetical protein [Cyanobacteria bacterium UBA8553]HAJ59236.1 hypothetical protein [Cyanobacteria bacterium UBA8543]